MFANNLFSQSVTENVEEDNSKANIGLGFGLDYGGLGGRITYLPVKNFGIFGALGYNLLELGFNAGAQYRFMPDKRVCPTIGAMYGYNGVIIIVGAEQHNKTYYGPSFSFGLEFKTGRKPKNFFNVELILPLRPQAFNDKIEELENDPSIKMESKPIPIGFSIGYHFGL